VFGMIRALWLSVVGDKAVSPIRSRRVMFGAPV